MNHGRPYLRRRGLAPLELVLWLPLLLFATALIVNFGTMAAWRVRGEVVARDAIWRARWPRTGNNEPRPAEKVWPKHAPMSLNVDRPLAPLEHPRLKLPVVRGPLPNEFVVLATLDPDRSGAARGQSEIERRYPLLPRLGKYESGKIQHPLLDEQWSVAQMRIDTNLTRRIPTLYLLPKTGNHLPQAFVAAVHDLFGMVHFESLRVLDDDAEIKKYTGRIVDFHPRVDTRIFGTSREQVQAKAVDFRVSDVRQPDGRVRLGGVSQLPRRMTEFFLNMYRREVDELARQLEEMRSELQALPDHIANIQRLERQLPRLVEQMQRSLHSNPAPTTSEAAEINELIRQTQSRIQTLPQELQSLNSRMSELPGLIGQTQATINELDAKIEQLQSFLEGIPDFENELRARYEETLRIPAP